MLRSLRDLMGYPVKALDGKAGKVLDCLVGDRRWRLRYLVVDTRPGFHFNLHYISAEEDRGKHSHVLISPQDLEFPEMGSGRHTFPVHLTKDEVVHSPSLETDAPMELRYNWEFTHYLRHEPYGRPTVVDPVSRLGYAPPESNYDHEDEEVREHERRMREISKSHLHSVKELLGYRVMAIDGDIGFVHDFILDVDRWEIRHLIVERGRWPITQKLQLGIRKTMNLDWTNRTVEVDLEKADLEIAPKFDPRTAVNRDEDQQRFDYYGQPRKWKGAGSIKM